MVEYQSTINPDITQITEFAIEIYWDDSAIPNNNLAFSSLTIECCYMKYFYGQAPDILLIVLPLNGLGVSLMIPFTFSRDRNISHLL